MIRSLKVERQFWLRDYRHLKLIDDIVELPEGLNQVLAEQINYLQLLTIELTFKRYAELTKTANTLKEEEVLAFLEKERDATFKQIKDLIKETK